MESLVVIKKPFYLGDEELGTFVVFDVVEGEVAGALYVGDGDMMVSLKKFVINYGDTLFWDTLNTRSLNTSYGELDRRITELKALLAEDGIVFDEVEAMTSTELLEDGLERVEGVYHVILTDVGFGNAKLDFNPRGLGYIGVVTEVSNSSIASGVRYKVMYTGTEASSKDVKSLLLCVGKRMELEQLEAQDRREFLRVTDSLKQELSELTGVALETIEEKLEAVTV